ncbi:reverse transcriptase family protein [Janthinobacterium sp. SUN073]|uniref:reverse transcriptase family protein n=1 Tax=Janthinobacterium sp. SUN073 TaxID=3004102 RepID=UPI0025B221E8|nr:reverse transcriptase family protein [Janthinobacterium sp. SUN073]MDN2699152.1 reverse transcriptase family protein [Janthinobacterium sp. SUN073]
MRNVINFSEFVELLQLDSDLLSLIPPISADSSKFYRKFKIPKRRGGYRTIDCPYPSLAAIQGKILSKFFIDFEAHPCAFAYRKKANALQHASCHLGEDELLTVDLKDFFSSISRQMVFQSLEKCGVEADVCQAISLLCCVDGILPQGACTSPVISNIVFHKIDSRLQSLAKMLNLTYSRYADDLAFSGKRIPRSLPRLIDNILKSRSFRLNADKTKLKILGAKKIITGVSISSGVAKVPKTYKRKLRAEIHELEMNVDNLAAMKKVDPLIYEKLLGKINYLLQIEPENKYAQAKKARLSNSHQQFMSLTPSIF